MGVPLPPPVAELADLIAAMPGTVALVLGGSRARASEVADGDWDLGLYYRRNIDLSALATRGVVHPPGSWGRIMNGGAWLDCDGLKVDVILRDLDIVEAWTHRAERGEFDVDALLGYIAGVPTYILTAELASCEPIYGHVTAVPYPQALAASAPPRWRFCRSFSLEYARMHARRGNHAATIAQAAKAVIEEGHAVLCERAEWVCNEKRLIESAGLAGVQRLFAQVPSDASELARWVDDVAQGLGESSSGGFWAAVARRATTESETD